VRFDEFEDVMADQEAESKVLPFPGVKPAKGVEAKWGKEVIDLGFTIVPSLLFKAQKRLGLSATQLAVLLQLMDHWWDNARNPWPGKKLLSEKLDLSPRQVQRVIADLEKRGYVQRIDRTSAQGGKLSNEYDLGGLVKKLRELAPEFQRVEEEVRNKRRALLRRGGLREPKTPK
jgi:predicted transcriptional regulator